ncbi:hypothetical protein EsH8_II_001201 [Colletotrichum jinshuiense]
MSNMFFSCRARQAPPPRPRPQCMYACCTRRSLKCESRTKGKGLLSLYCKDHACRQRLGELMCPNPKEAGMSKYCEDHRRCQSQGCASQRICADTSQDWPYCQKRLSLPRLPMAVSPHADPVWPSRIDTCSLNGCHQKRSSKSKMCGFHTPMCLIPGCGEPRTENGLYCPCHSCTDRDCNSIINGGNWCKDHRLCRTEGCGLPRAVTSGGRGNVRFCPQHECMYTPCREPKDNAEDTARLYCKNHTCHHKACPQPTADPTNPSTTRYCVAHRCAGAGCDHPSKPSGRHCALHACLHASCPSPRAADPLAVPGCQFCIAHECRVSGCHDATRPDASYCDATHACAVPGCPAPRGLPGEGAGSVCCASHAAMIARDGAAGWGFQCPPERRPAAPQPQPQRPIYLSQAEEALGQRLCEERERHDQETRLAEEMRAWHAATSAAAAAGAARGGGSGGGGGGDGGPEMRGRRGRGERVRSYDSGFGGSPTWSDATNFTFVG